MTAPRTPDTDAVVVRPATLADAAAIAGIWREGWADGHAGHVPEALVAERTPASFGPRALERIDRTWVAERGGVVAGFVVVVTTRWSRSSSTGTRAAGAWPGACSGRPRR